MHFSYPFFLSFDREREREGERGRERDEEGKLFNNSLQMQKKKKIMLKEGFSFFFPFYVTWNS